LNKKINSKNANNYIFSLSLFWINCCLIFRANNWLILLEAIYFSFFEWRSLQNDFKENIYFKKEKKTKFKNTNQEVFLILINIYKKLKYKCNISFIYIYTYEIKKYLQKILNNIGAKSEIVEA